jgi:hypothetical protein
MTGTPTALFRCVAFLLLPGLIMAGRAEAQEVVLRGGSDPTLDRRLARVLEGAPLVVSRDTAVARGDTIRGSVLVLDATIIHEGTITGDLVLVDAGAFVRPGATVGGDILNVAGGLYRSELARVGGRIIDLPTAPYRVTREARSMVIEAVRVDSPFRLDGFMGVHPPGYDRANGLSLVWGGSYEAPAVAGVQARLHGQAGWLTQRGDPTYGVALGLRRGHAELAVGHDRAWDTNERRIRDDLMNSLVYLWNGTDLRDYHEVRRTWAALSRDLLDGTGRLGATIALQARVEDATSLVAGQPWSILSPELRENPAVDDGRITSLAALADVTWAGEQTRFRGSVEYEAARTWRDGEFHFGRLHSTGDWAMLAFANHTLAIDYVLQRPIGDRALPRQRWTFVGGPNTLHTLPLAAHYGDHLAFVETRYVIPMPDHLAVPVLGAARFHLIHAAGMAWTGDDHRSLHQEVGLLVDLAIIHLRYSVVPDDPGTTDFSVSLSWPFDRRYPWER